MLMHPPFNAQAVRANEIEVDALRASAGASPRGGILQTHHKKSKVRHDKHRPVVSCSGEATRH